MKGKNIVVIMADQLRKDSLGCYGNAVVNTPHIDRLANQGVQFDRCYVANPICMPNRLSIFTGMYPRNHGLWTNGLLLEHERRTLPMELLERGYQTASFGKIHFEPTACPVDCGSRESREYWESKGGCIEDFGPYWGFEHVELTIGHSTRAAGHYGKWFREKGGTADMLEPDKNGCTSVPAELHDSSFIGERISTFICEEREKDRPFFVVASFPDPHHPFNPPKAYAERYGLEDALAPTGGPEDLKTRPEHYRQHFKGAWHRKGVGPEKRPLGIGKDEESRRIINTYAMVDLIDYNVGRILDALEQQGLMEDTIIVFTADHGELLGDHGLWAKGPFFYEGLINVPLIIYDKDRINPFVSEELVSSIDIVPTLCDLNQMPVPLYVNGVSQMAHLEDPAHSVRNCCMTEYRNGYGEKDCAARVLVTKDMKYVRYQTGECELTDLQNDPQERTNVAHNEEYGNRAKEMTAQLLDEMLSTEAKDPIQIAHA